MPEYKLDAGTFYMPMGVEKSEEDGLYRYEEYRFNLPVDYEMPREIYGMLCNALIVNVGRTKQTAERLEATESGLAEIAEIVSDLATEREG